MPCLVVEHPLVGFVVLVDIGRLPADAVPPTAGQRLDSGEYRDLAYVKAQCASLAQQLKALEG